MPSALLSLLHLTSPPPRVFAGALGPVTGLQTRPSKLSLEALACSNPLDSTGVTPNTPTTGCKNWGGGLGQIGHWTLVSGLGSTPVYGAAGAPSLPPLGHSQGWSGSVHPGEEELMFIHEVVTWLWLRR